VLSSRDPPRACEFGRAEAAWSRRARFRKAATSGGTDLYDAIYLACHDELATEAGRKGVIILTDAEDTGSKLGMQDAIEAAQRSDAVIHVLLISDRDGNLRHRPWRCAPHGGRHRRARD
jgi:hypothetical protein